MRRANTHPLEDNQGLTLVELLVALAMAAMLSVALIATFTSFSRTQTTQENVISMQQNLRAALYIMGRDLRMAGYRGPNPAGAPAAGFLTANADNLSFTVLDDATNNLTTISYVYDSAEDTIRRNGDIVAENIDGVEFYYTLAGGGQSTAPTTLGNIRSMDITILARTNRNDPDFSNTTTYPTPSGGAPWGPYNDGRRRRVGESFILFRNM